MTHAYVYIRFSSVKQEKGSSRERQREVCEKHCQTNGWTVVEVIEDLGVSAWKGNHLTTGNLGKFADRVRSGEIPPNSILVTENLDRLSRQEPRKTQRWLEDITDCGLRIAAIASGRIFDAQSLRSPTALVEIIDILLNAFMANKLSEAISARVRDSWERRRNDAKTSGKVASSHIPPWFRVVGERIGKDIDTRKIEAIPDRADIVRQIYQMAVDGLGARTIARTLNERDVKPWGKSYHHAASKNVGWEHTFVSDILAHPSVEGDYVPATYKDRIATPTGERFVGYFGEPIVDAHLVAAARAAVASRRGTGGRHRTVCANLFTGLARCGHCGGKMMMFGSGSKLSRFLACNDANRGRRCNHKKFFHYQPFEQAALDAMLPLALDNRFFDRPDDTQRLVIEVAELERTLGIKREEAKRLAMSLARTQSEFIEVALMDLEREIRGWKARLDDAEKRLRNAQAALSPHEHLKRVVEVRGALEDSAPDIKLKARQRVSEAIRNVVDYVECRTEENGDKRVDLSILGGARHLTYINTVLVQDYDRTKETAARMEIKSGPRPVDLWSKADPRRVEAMQRLAGGSYAVRKPPMMLVAGMDESS